MEHAHVILKSGINYATPLTTDWRLDAKRARLTARQWITRLTREWWALNFTDDDVASVVVEQ